LLIAQDSTYYGLDLYQKRNLSELLKHLADIDGLEWIRLHYAYPSGFPVDILDVMASRTNICNYLDIPLQHGSDKVLKIMRRGIDRSGTEELLQKIREKVPGIAIRTTLIVGHPGEGEKEFEELKEFVQQSRFERMGVFTYSHEEGTHAFLLKDETSQKIKEKRQMEIMGIQESISRQYNENKIGQTLKVLVDRFESGYFIGRTEHDSPEVDNEVLVEGKDNYLRIGDFVPVRIIDATEFDLHGVVAQ